MRKCLACLGVGLVLHSLFWGLLAYIGLLLNLLNLVPMLPLDGGRIAGAISRWLWPVGLLALVGVFVVTGNSFVLFILVLGALQMISRFRARGAGGLPAGYYDVGLAPRLILGGLYFALLVLIVVAMVLVQQSLGLQGTGW